MANDNSQPQQHLPDGREYIVCDGPGCSEKGPPKRCSRCRMTFYCGVACQRTHWKTGHKTECTDINYFREQIMNIGGEDNTATTKTSTSTITNSSCFICLSESIVDPYTLPKCGHTFCFSCLHHWQGMVGEYSHSLWQTPSSSSKHRTCPACRTEAPDLYLEVHETALLYAARANRGDKSKEERDKYSELALAELGRIHMTGANRQDSSKTIQTLFTKAQVLQQLERPAEALLALEELEAVHRQGHENAAKITSLLNSLQALENQGRNSEADRVARQLEEMREANVRVVRMENHGFDLYIKMAECFEDMQEYKKAFDTYKFKMMAVIDYDNPVATGTPPQQRKMFMGMSRCLYHMGDYENAIGLGEGAIQMNRHFPQVHKYVALSQKAAGDLQGAVQTMGRAVTYETPWDEANQKIVLKMYEELKRAPLPAA